MCFFSGFFGHRSHLLGYLSLGNVNPCKGEKQEAFETIAGRGWEEHIEPQPTWRLIVVTIYSGKIFKKTRLKIWSSTRRSLYTSASFSWRFKTSRSYAVYLREGSHFTRWKFIAAAVMDKIRQTGCSWQKTCHSSSGTMLSTKHIAPLNHMKMTSWCWTGSGKWVSLNNKVSHRIHVCFAPLHLLFCFFNVTHLKLNL